MTGKVIFIDEKKPHMYGTARCLNCFSTHIAVIQEDGRARKMQCPFCMEYESVFVDEIEQWELLNAISEALADIFKGER